MNTHQIELARSDTRFSISIVVDPDALWRLKPQWDELWLRAQGRYTQTERSCYYAWHIDRDPSPRRMHTITGWLGGRLVLLWPLIIRRRHGLWNALMPLGPDANEYTDVLVEPGPKAESHVAEAWASLLRTCRADIVRLPYVRVDTPLHAALRSPEQADDAKQPSSRILTVAPNVAPYVAWQGVDDWDHYYMRLRASYRKVLNRKRRQLCEKYAVRCDVVSDPARRTQTLIWFLKRKRHWARRVGKSSPWLHDASYERYLHGMINESGCRNILIFALLADDEIIAVQIACVGSHRFECIMAAFDAEWDRFSPGLLLNEYCLKWAFERKLEVDFGIGSEENKLFWSQNIVCELLYYRIAGTRWGVVIENMRVAVEIAKLSIRRMHNIRVPALSFLSRH